MSGGLAVPDAAQRSRVLAVLLLLFTLGAPVCKAAADSGDPSATPGDRKSFIVRDVGIRRGEPVTGFDAVVVVDGDTAARVRVTIPCEPPVSRRAYEVRRTGKATAEAPRIGFFARVLKPLLLRIARQIIALQFRELIRGETS